ncbi:MAG: class I SAM-dependent methyltransferase [Candidatus Latescibacteria bacterium]|jgi:SAM-dependent methyltransferase|nr:class I SAM-dependent methyltransferase [Candidatus Latescibacterota bacterium]
MIWTALDPPGSLLHYARLRSLVGRGTEQRILEVACGSGQLAIRLALDGHEVTAIDANGASLADAWRALDSVSRVHDCSIRFADVEWNLGTAEQFCDFDLVVAAMVVEHIDDDHEFVRSLCSALRSPGGRLCIAVPARMDKWSIEDEAHGHFRRYSPESLRDLLKSCGLKHITIHGSGFPVTNLTFSFGNRIVSRSETERLEWSPDDRTLQSGNRKVRWKTEFPSLFRFLLNDRVFGLLELGIRPIQVQSRCLELIALGSLGD